MGPEQVQAWAEVLKATSPYGIVVILGYVLWKVSSSYVTVLKDQQKEVIDLARTQNEAVTAVKGHLEGINSGIQDLKQLVVTAVVRQANDRPKSG